MVGTSQTAWRGFIVRACVAVSALSGCAVVSPVDAEDYMFEQGCHRVSSKDESQTKGKEKRIDHDGWSYSSR